MSKKPENSAKTTSTAEEKQKPSETSVFNSAAPAGQTSEQRTLPRKNAELDVLREIRGEKKGGNGLKEFTC